MPKQRPEWTPSEAYGNAVHAVNVLQNACDTASLRNIKKRVDDALLLAFGQIAADYGQFRALRGETSPKKLAQLFPEGIDDATTTEKNS